MLQISEPMGLPIPPLDEVLTFTVEGKPIGKGRPRITRNGTYTPKKTREYEKLIAWTFRRRYPRFKPCKGPVFMTVIAYFPIPKNTTKKLREKMEREEVFRIKKPDWDNIGKIVCDALNGIAWEDDNQVMGFVLKFYSPRPRIEVMIGEVMADGA